MKKSIKQRCGFAAIIGKPNVGKSTLLNHIIGQKVSITSRKPQTTRNKILGIKTTNAVQIIYCDTPGLHQDLPRKINEFMVNEALKALHEVDILIFMIDIRQWNKEDDFILKKIAQTQAPVFVALNKIDKVIDKKKLLPLIKTIQEKFLAANLSLPELVPVSAKNNQGIDVLEKAIAKHLPESEFLFDKEQITDKSMRFLASEIIREKLMRYLGEELPHTLTVEIEKFKTVKNILHIHAIIWVERKGQKIIIIGKKGEKLKMLGQLAREDMEKQFDTKIYLNLWVKVKTGWTDDLRALASLGFRHDDS